MIAAYREPDKQLGKKAIKAVIDAVSNGVSTALVELRRLGRTLRQRAVGMLAGADAAGQDQVPKSSPTVVAGRLRVQ